MPKQKLISRSIRVASPDRVTTVTAHFHTNAVHISGRGKKGIYNDNLAICVGTELIDIYIQSQYTYTYIYIYVCIVYIYIQMCIYIYIQMCIYIYTQMYIYIHIIYIYIYICFVNSMFIYGCFGHIQTSMIFKVPRPWTAPSVSSQDSPALQGLFMRSINIYKH